MAKQLKLTQVIGKRLDPNSKYVFLFDGNTTPYGQVIHFTNEMKRLMGDNFSVTLTNGNPKKAFEVFEIDEKQRVNTIDPIKVDMAAGPKPFDEGYPGQEQRKPGFFRTEDGAVVPDVSLPGMSELSENEA